MLSLQQNWRSGKNKFCLGVRGVGEEGAMGRDGPNNVYTYK
jgi:hypothetical protein